MKHLVAVIGLSAVLLGGCATAVMSGAHQGPQTGDDRSWEEAREDSQLKRAIVERLVDDPLVPAMDINVQTYRGRVTLTGTVPSRAAANRAVELATRVRYVGTVVDRLEIR